MAKKKLDAVKNMSVKELNQGIVDAQKSLFEGKIRHATGQLENTGTLWQTRKSIAQLKTFLTQKTTK